MVLGVADDGPGIPQEVLPHIFEKFYKGAGGGAGLGLAIAEQIARHHGGSIEVESVPGRTVFTLRLPAVELGDENDA
jgi:signal transduction histidine kinase